MSVYIRRIQVENYGAIENVDYNMPFDGEGNPKPVVLVGKNGSGKTLILSNILHSLIEIKREFYTSLSEVSGSNYYRLGSKRYIRETKNFSYCRLDFDNAYSIDLMVNNYEMFKNTIDTRSYPDITLEDSKLKDSGFYSNIKKTESNVFEKNIYLYFPVDRYYIPTWENTENDNLSFVTDDKAFVGRDNLSIVQYNLLEELETWLLDVIIDKMLYESKIISLEVGDNTVPRPIFVGKNNNIQNSINNILTKIYVNEKYQSVRIGISSKQHRKIAVIGKLNNGNEEEIAPKFSSLSSGQIMILGIFSSIIRAYDKIYEGSVLDFKNISGVVLIDEIDAHLHSDLLKDVLPELVALFPKIQFIISIHSPFFLLGMKDKFESNCEFVALPTGTVLDSIDKFDELRKCYSIIDESYQNILDNKEKYERQVKDLSKPLIITEGKTDWKHLKHALKCFKESEKFCELDIRFLEYDYEFSDSKLETLLNQLAKVPNANKIIGVFDSDSATGKVYESVKNFGNNVYGCCISDVLGYGCGISIELLYSRTDLTKEAADKRRIYLSDEFTEKSQQLKENPNVVCHNNTLKDAFKRNIIKVVDSGVFNSQEDSLALSKENFANYILNEEAPFETVSVDGFGGIFEIVEDIINGVYN